MNTRRVAALLGIAAFVGALASVFGVLEFGLTSSTIALVGLLALGIGLFALSRGYGARSHAETPDPERRTAATVPGASLTDVLDEFRGVTPDYVVTSRRLTDGLRAAAVAALTRFEGDSIERADERLEAGTWTDDPVAAATLSESSQGPSRSVRTRVKSLVSRDSGADFRTGIRHTVAAIAAVGADPTADDGASDAERPALPEYDGASGADGPQRRTRTTTRTVDGIDTGRQGTTDHWTGVGAVALFAVGVGAIAESPAVVLAGVVGAGYVGFARAFEPPALELSLERTLSDDDPAPGDEVDVTVTIANESDRFVPDLRIVDGVPEGLAVTDGSSRLGTALRPGETVALEYTVTARRGTHAFDPALAIARDLTRSAEREYLVGTETTVVCQPSMRALAASVPLRRATTPYAGRIRTDDGGSGTTLHSVREYRKSDPLNRIDWNRRAKTGDLATLEFHEERTARVVVLIDAREAAYLAPAPDAAHAVDRSVDAAGRIGATLLASDETVGLAGIGPAARNETEAGSDPCWLPPAAGRHHEVQLRDLLATHPQFETRPPGYECRWRRQLRTIRRRLPTDTQLVFLTPLCDYGAVTIARRLEAHGHPVTVVSPDPTADRTAGQQLSRVARRVRHVDLQRSGIPVVDWPADESLDAVLARHAGGRR